LTVSHILKKVRSVINGFGVAAATNLCSQHISGSWNEIGWGRKQVDFDILKKF
jgi:hypothetical protein